MELLFGIKYSECFEVMEMWFYERTLRIPWLVKNAEALWKIGMIRKQIQTEVDS